MFSRRSLVAGAAVLLLLLSACGGDDGGSADPGQSESTDGGNSDDGGSTDDNGSSDDGSSSSGGGTTDDTCHLVTRDEANAVLGGDVDFDEAEGSPGNCVYNWMDPGSPLDMVQLQVGFQPGVTGQMPLSEFAQRVAEPVGNTEIEELSGLGDGAYLTSGGMLTLLFVESDGGILTIGVMGADDEAGVAEELAEIALGRL